jgi:hypothetical protein
MTAPEIALVAIFAAVWLLPALLAVRWEHRHRSLRSRVAERPPEAVSADGTAAVAFRHGSGSAT